MGLPKNWETEDIGKLAELAMNYLWYVCMEKCAGFPFPTLMSQRNLRTTYDFILVLNIRAPAMAMSLLRASVLLKYWDETQSFVAEERLVGKVEVMLDGLTQEYVGRHGLDWVEDIDQIAKLKLPFEEEAAQLVALVEQAVQQNDAEKAVTLCENLFNLCVLDLRWSLGSTYISHMLITEQLENRKR